MHIAPFSYYCYYDSCTQDYCQDTICLACHSYHEQCYYHHDFYYDEEKDLYVCYKCGLESDTDETGSIVIEDLKGEYDYIVGYALNEPIPFSVHLSMVNKESKVETVLNNLKMKHDNNYRAYIISKDDVINYFASESLNPSDYDLKVSFVSNASGSAEVYSLTF